MKLVLDSSAILSGKLFSGDNEFYTSPSISQEMEKSEMREQYSYMLDAGLLIMAPSKDSIRKVWKSADKTGDINRLSEPDIEILGLALEVDGIIVTNDYSIQNLACEMNIRYMSPTEDVIENAVTWEFQCKGCAQIFSEKLNECPICGSQLRFKPKKIKKI